MREIRRGVTVIVSLSVIFVAFLTAIIDIIFGMGFGLTLTPILLFLGYTPKAIVPAILLSSLGGGVFSALFNHRFKNADFTPGSQHFKIVLVVGGVGIAGGIVGARVNAGISDLTLTLYIGTLILMTGVFLLLNRTLHVKFSWTKLGLLSLFASFNKGISGSGFGPIVTTGLLYMNTGEKAAVSIQSFSELFVSLFGFATFFASGAKLNWDLTWSLLIGVTVSTPLAAFIVKRVQGATLRKAIAVVTAVLGAATLLQVFL